MTRLVDGPFPAWMVTASIAATILTMIPVATVGLNHHLTMQGYFPLLRYSPTLRFTVFGAMAMRVDEDVRHPLLKPKGLWFSRQRSVHEFLEQETAPRDAFAVLDF